MKIIEVSDEIYEKLVALSNEINNQDKKCPSCRNNYGFPM